MQRLSDMEVKEYLLKAQSAEYQVCVWGAGKLGTGVGKRFLEDYNIFIDYYCDNNQELLDTQIIEGIFCRSHDYLIDNNEGTICFVLVGYIASSSVYTQLKKMGIKYIVTYEDILGYSVTLKKYFPFMSKKDTVIYTCITGEYDDIREPEYISEQCDYYLLSEKQPQKETIFQWIDIKDVIPPYISDNIYKNRYCKMKANKIFPQYRYSVYVDGNITITGDIAESTKYLKRAKIAVMTMYEKDTVYSQALRCMVQGADYPDRWQKQIRDYWLQGLPESTMAYLCNMLVREHNNPICIKLMDDWWKEFCKYTRRDQISFPYVLWKNGIVSEDILELDKLFCVNHLEKNMYWIYDPTHKREKYHI